jgi:hypothetical protein
MTDAARLEPGTGAGGPPRERASPADSHASWRRELERAQGQLRAPAVPTGAARPRGAGPAGVPARAGGAEPAVASARAAAPGRARASSPLSPAPPADARADAPLPASRPSAPLHGAGLASRPVDPCARAPAAPGARSPTAWASRGAPWPATNAHASVQASLATVWIRNAALDPASPGALPQLIRARLRSLGVQLVELFVNGRRVGDAGTPPPSIRQPKGGEDGN